MKHFFYYTKDSQGRTKTVCLAVQRSKTGTIIQRKGWARGIAVCCDRDNHHKKVGRNIAQHRADKASRWRKHLIKPNGFVMAHFEPELTPLELKFIHPYIREATE